LYQNTNANKFVRSAVAFVQQALAPQVRVAYA